VGELGENTGTKFSREVIDKWSIPNMDWDECSSGHYQTPVIGLISPHGVSENPA